MSVADIKTTLKSETFCRTWGVNLISVIMPSLDQQHVGVVLSGLLNKYSCFFEIRNLARDIRAMVLKQHWLSASWFCGSSQSLTETEGVSRSWWSVDVRQNTSLAWWSITTMTQAGHATQTASSLLVQQYLYLRTNAQRAFDGKAFACQRFSFKCSYLIYEAILS